MKEINIFYDNEEVSIESVFEDLKNSISSRDVPTSPELNRIVESYSRITSENLTFSIDLEDIRKFHQMNWNPEYKIKEIVKDLKKNSENVSVVKVDEFGHKWGWIGTVNRFLRAVQELAGRLLQPKEYQLKEVERFQEEKVRKAARKRKPIKQFDPTVPEEQEDDGVYTHLCLHFGKMFFLDPSPVKRKPIVIKEKIVISEPHARYDLPRGIEAKFGSVPSVAFIIEVKRPPIAFPPGKPLEEKLGTNILGQIGIELFAESSYSVFRPNSFGIICMKTKLIFVYLKMPQEHALHILENKPLAHKGIVEYTREFDMLKTGDRTQILNLMYWLGCIQQNENLT